MVQHTISKTYGVDINDDEIVIETPPKKEFWHFCFAPFILAKRLQQPAPLLAKELGTTLKEIYYDTIKEIQVVGPYVNIRFQSSFYAQIFKESIVLFPNVGNSETIIVDYIGANLGKPLHIGHLLPSLYGQVYINLLRTLGYTVIGDNHIGDWGIIFWKIIYAMKHFWTKEPWKYSLEEIHALYIEASQKEKQDTSFKEHYRKEFQALAQANRESITYWKIIKEKSIASMEQTLQRLAVKEDITIWESFYEWIQEIQDTRYPPLQETMQDIVKELIQKWIAVQNEDNSVGVIFPETYEYPSCVLQKKDGTHGYFASDLACIKYRQTHWNPKKIIYFSDMRQKLHFEQCFTVAKLAGWIPQTELIHAMHGAILLWDEIMSTKSGNIVKLEDILNEAEKKAYDILMQKQVDMSHEEMEYTAKIIGIGSIKYGIVSKNRCSNIHFDWNAFLSFEGNSFPYIAYSYVRTLRLLEKFPPLSWSPLWERYDSLTEEEIDLLILFSFFPNVLVKSYIHIQTHILTDYLYSLAKAFNIFYQKVPIIAHPTIEKKWILTQYKTILEAICFILGIPLPSKM